MTPISPWDYHAELRCPDGQGIAVFDGSEIAMGSPAFGSLIFRSASGDYTISESAASSMVWSDDSSFLAFSEWTRSRQQKLCVFNRFNRNVHRCDDDYRVIQLNSFDKLIIAGVDSPIHKPYSFTIDYRMHTEPKTI